MIGSSLRQALRTIGVETHDISFRDIIHSGSANLKFLEELKLDALIHLAWTASSTQNYLDSQDNFSCAKATVELAKVQLNCGGGFIAFGSVLDAGLGESAYAKSKTWTRDALSEAIDAHSMTWLRPYFVFSRGRWPNFLKFANNQSDVQLRDNFPREYVALDDVVNAILFVLEHRIGGLVDVGPGYKTSPLALLSAFGVVGHVQGSSDAQINIPLSDSSQLRSVGWSASKTDEILGRQIG